MEGSVQCAFYDLTFSFFLPKTVCGIYDTHVTDEKTEAQNKLSSPRLQSEGAMLGFQSSFLRTAILTQEWREMLWTSQAGEGQGRQPRLKEENTDETLGFLISTGFCAHSKLYLKFCRHSVSSFSYSVCQKSTARSPRECLAR